MTIFVHYLSSYETFYNCSKEKRRCALLSMSFSKSVKDIQKKCGFQFKTLEICGLFLILLLMFSFTGPTNIVPELVLTEVHQMPRILLRKVIS